MDWLTEAFEPVFMQRALAAGLLAVVATSVVGTWVVLRGMAFLGDALAHGVIPGIALAILWGFDPVVGALAAAVVMGLAVTVVSSRTRVREETSVGLLFVGMLALGVLVISKSDSFATDVTALLFGDVLGVSGSDLVTQAVAAGLVVAFGAVFYRPFLALTFNRDKAATLGLHPAAAHAVLLLLLAVSIVASFRAIGTLLVFGLLIGPPATAALLVRRVAWIVAVSIGIGAMCVVAGLVVSFHQGTAGGATIAFLAIVVFFAVFAAQEVVTWARSRTPGRVPVR